MSHHKARSNHNQNDQLCLAVKMGNKSNIANHFGYAWFMINLSVNLSSKFSINPQPINAKLLYGDGQLVDVENDVFLTEPRDLNLNRSGICSFEVKINTYSTFHNNRTFKITFQCSENATRHITSCETTTFRLVKHRLEIVVEPAEKFYKDEGGRANCLNCTIVLKNSKRHTVKNRDIPLNVKLVYNPDLNVAQSSRDILEILTQKIHLQKGECHLDFRINEVSKNHNKRAFSVLVECQKNDPLSNDISSCYTRPIMVYSKRTKPRIKKQKKRSRKRANITINSDSDFDHSYSDTENEDINKSNSINEPQSKRRKLFETNANFVPNYSQFDANYMSSTIRNANNSCIPPSSLNSNLRGIMPSVVNHGRCGLPYNPPLNSIGGLNSRKTGPSFKCETEDTSATGLLGRMFDWCKLAEYVMQRLEWTKCGYEYNEATASIDANRPLYRCAYCLRYKNQNGWGSHENWCQLQYALLQYQDKIQSTAQEYQMQCMAAPIGSMNILDQSQCAPPTQRYVNGTDGGDVIQRANAGNRNMSLNTVLTTHSMKNMKGNGMDAQNRNAFSMGVSQTFNSNGLGFLPGISFQMPSAISPMVSGNSMIIPQMLLNSPSMMFRPPPHLMSFNELNNNMNSNGNSNGNLNSSKINDKKNEKKSMNILKIENNENNGSIGISERKIINDENVNVILPTIMPRINSVARERSKHGFAAFDDNQELLGFFNTDFSFLDVDQMINFDEFTANSETNFMMRSESNDYNFFQEIQHNIESNVTTLNDDSNNHS